MARRRRKKNPGWVALLIFPIELLRRILLTFAPKKRTTARRVTRQQTTSTRARSTKSTKSEIRQWISTQLAQGIPRQDIVNQLNARANQLLPDMDTFGRQAADYAKGKRASLPTTKEANACMDEANRIEQIMIERNFRGQILEKEGKESGQKAKIDQAIALYELNLADRFDGTHPYDRLRIIYTRREQYHDAVRVCEAYVALPDRKNGQNKDHFRHHLDGLKPKAAKISRLTIVDSN